MKKLIALITSTSLVLAPSVALAHQGSHDELFTQGQAEVHLNTRPVKAEVRAEMHASSTKDRPFQTVQKLGPAIRNVASSTRAEWKGMASTTREAVRMKVQAIHDLILQKKEAMKERADAAREKAKSRFGEKVEKHVGNITERFSSTTAKLISIADRAEDRIDELEAEGLDMDASLDLLATVRADITTAQEKILAVTKALETTVSSTTPKGELPAVRAAVKAAEEALRVVKEDLHQLLRSIKVEGGAHATTTSAQ